MTSSPPRRDGGGARGGVNGRTACPRPPPCQATRLSLGPGWIDPRDPADSRFFRCPTGHRLPPDGARAGTERQARPSRASAPRQLLPGRSDPRVEVSTRPLSPPSRSLQGPFGFAGAVPAPVGPAPRRSRDWRCRSARAAVRGHGLPTGQRPPSVRFCPFERVAWILRPSSLFRPCWTPPPSPNPGPSRRAWRSARSSSSPPSSVSPSWTCVSWLPYPDDVQVMYRASDGAARYAHCHRSER